MTAKTEISLTEKQIEFYEASKEFSVVFYGGAKGGGKSYGLRNICLIRAMETPGLKVAIFRRTYPELRANIIDPLLLEHPWLRNHYNKSEHIITIPELNSTIEFCHLQNPDDVHLYQGREYDIIGIEEAGQWTEEIFQRLRGSNRTTKPGVKPCMLLTGNPGGIGHGWLKRLFVEKNYNDREKARDYYFIPAKVYDNPVLLEFDPEYVSRLEAEPNEVIRRAYLDGDWDVFAGQFFSEWRHEIHVCEPFQIPNHWVRFCSYDPGYFHPTAMGWFACDEVGHVYLYRELIKRGMRPDEVAREYHSYPDADKIEAIYAGRDCWAKGRDGQPSIAEQFSELPDGLQMFLTEANIDRIQGAAQVRSFMAWQNLPDGLEGPRFKVFKTCEHTAGCLPRMIHDPKRPEDVLKVDATEADPFCGDDPYDMVRYGLMSRPLQSDAAPKEVKIVPYDQRVKAWNKKRKERMARSKKTGAVDSTLGGNW